MLNINIKQHSMTMDEGRIWGVVGHSVNFDIGEREGWLGLLW